VGEVTERVESGLRALIESGEYAPGDQLPSERQLTVQLGAGRTTVRTVLQKLVLQGVLEAQHGRGYFVAKPKTRRR
jgi:DNA-binding GntR family transcriptional regulator